MRSRSSSWRDDQPAVRLDLRLRNNVLRRGARAGEDGACIETEFGQRDGQRYIVDVERHHEHVGSVARLIDVLAVGQLQR